jgi:hypothetical protein
MSWYNENYKARWPISVDQSAWSSGATDIQVVIPPSMDIFWDTVEITGHDVRFTAADGTTELTFKRSTWNYASKAAIFEIDAITPTQACQQLLWLYWDYASATDGATTPTITSPVTGRLHILGPVFPIAKIQEETAAQQRPNFAFPVDTGSTRTFWFNLDRILSRRAFLSEGLDYGEEISEVVASVVSTADSAVASAILQSNTRFTGRGGRLVGVKVDGSKLTDGTNYAIKLVVTTAGPNSYTNTHVIRSGLYCQNVRPRT